MVAGTTMDTPAKSTVRTNKRCISLKPRDQEGTSLAFPALVAGLLTGLYALRWVTLLGHVTGHGRHGSACPLESESRNGKTNRESLAIEASPDELDRIQHGGEHDCAMGGT